MLAASLYLTIVLAAIAAIDARYGIIPDPLVAGLALGGALQVYLAGDEPVWRHGAEAAVLAGGALLFRASYKWLRGNEGLGLGDVKFLGAAAFWIDLDDVSGLLLIAVVSAAISLLILRSKGYSLHGKQAIPFGPHLVTGLALIWAAKVFNAF